MRKFPVFLVVTALLTACGTVAGSTSSSADKVTNTGAVRLVEAGNSDSELDVNRVNSPIAKGARSTPFTPVQPKGVTPNQAKPQAADRCSQGFGTAGFSPRAAGPAGKQPLPMCAVE